MNWDNKVAGCELCEQVGGELIWQNEQLRVILVDDPLFVGFTRVIWQEHAAEMTDLAPEQRSQLMRVSRYSAMCSNRLRLISPVWAIWSRMCTGTSFRATPMMRASRIPCGRSRPNKRKKPNATA